MMVVLRFIGKYDEPIFDKVLAKLRLGWKRKIAGVAPDKI